MMSTHFAFPEWNKFRKNNFEFWNVGGSFHTIFISSFCIVKIWFYLSIRKEICKFEDLKNKKKKKTRFEKMPKRKANEIENETQKTDNHSKWQELLNSVRKFYSKNFEFFFFFWLFFSVIIFKIEQSSKIQKHIQIQIWKW